MKAKILIADDEENIRNILSHLLSDEGFEVLTANDGLKAVQVTDKEMPDIVILDKNMPKLDGIETLKKIKAAHPHITVIIITAYGAVSSAVDAIKSGAYDYIEKPFDNKKIILLVKRALEHHQLSQEVKNLRKTIDNKYSFDKIIGISSNIKQVLEQVKSVCETDATVLITGESGTGKELIAQAIHYNSLRKGGPLIALNCGAVPTQLIESELFGHEKGAFTDAREMQTGKFELANNGTLFLDEIGEMPLDAQVKLLRVMEERKITRIGGKKNIPLNIRLISATNINLEEKVQGGAFRLDLFYRLNIFTITIPPLRARKEDIPLLTEYFVNKYKQKHNLDINGVNAEAMEMLVKYHWPGNIRDLENAIQSAMIVAKKGCVQPAHLPVRVNYPEIFEKETRVSPEMKLANINEISSMMEKEAIFEALRQFKYNRTLAATALNMSRKTLFNKMKKYGMLE